MCFGQRNLFPGYILTEKNLRNFSKNYNKAHKTNKENEFKKKLLLNSSYLLKCFNIFNINNFLFKSTKNKILKGVSKHLSLQ